MLKTKMRTKNLTGGRRAFDPFFGTLGPQTLEGSLWDQEICYIVAPFSRCQCGGTGLRENQYIQN